MPNYARDMTYSWYGKDKNNLHFLHLKLNKLGFSLLRALPSLRTCT